jgi:hypothetical protein
MHNQKRIDAEAANCISLPRNRARPKPTKHGTVNQDPHFLKLFWACM